MRNPEEKYMRHGALKVMIAGHGGQGVLDLGNFIAYQAVRNGYHVVYTPTYGPETRGGKVRCWVTTAMGEIDSPIAEELDVLLILNKPSMDFVPQLRLGGMLLYNISLIDRYVQRDDISAIPIACTDLAACVGADLNPAYAKTVDTGKTLNCIMYGGYLACMGYSLKKALSDTEEIFKNFYRGEKSRYIPMNIAAVNKGFEVLKQYGWKTD